MSKNKEETLLIIDSRFKELKKQIAKIPVAVRHGYNTQTASVSKAINIADEIKSLINYLLNGGMNESRL